MTSRIVDTKGWVTDTGPENSFHVFAIALQVCCVIARAPAEQRITVEGMRLEWRFRPSDIFPAESAPLYDFWKHAPPLAAPRGGITYLKPPDLAEAP